MADGFTSQNEILYDVNVTGVESLDQIQAKVEAISAALNISSDALGRFYDMLQLAGGAAGNVFAALQSIASAQASIFQDQANLARAAMAQIVSDAESAARAGIDSRIEAERVSATTREALERQVENVRREIESGDVDGIARSLGAYRDAAQERMQLLRDEADAIGGLGALRQQRPIGLITEGGLGLFGTDTSGRLISQGGEDLAGRISSPAISNVVIPPQLQPPAVAPQLPAPSPYPIPATAQARALPPPPIEPPVINMTRDAGGVFRALPVEVAQEEEARATKGFLGPSGWGRFAEEEPSNFRSAGGSGFGGFYGGAGGRGSIPPEPPGPPFGYGPRGRGFGGGGEGPPGGEGGEGGIKDILSSFTPHGPAGGFIRGITGLGFFGSTGFFAGEVIRRSTEELIHFVDETTHAAQETQNMAMRLDISTVDMQKLAAEAQILGVNIGTVGIATRTLSQALEDAASTGKKPAAALAQLGVAMIGTGGGARELGEVFQDTIQKLSEVEDVTKRTQLAYAIFGRNGGREIMPLIDNLKVLDETVKELGVGSNENLIDNLARTHQEIEKLSVAWDLFKGQLIEKFEPAIMGTLAKLTGLLSDANKGGGKGNKQNPNDNPVPSDLPDLPGSDLPSVMFGGKSGTLEDIKKVWGFLGDAVADMVKGPGEKLDLKPTKMIGGGATDEFGGVNGKPLSESHAAAKAAFANMAKELSETRDGLEADKAEAHQAVMKLRSDVIKTNAQLQAGGKNADLILNGDALSKQIELRDAEAKESAIQAKIKALSAHPTQTGLRADNRFEEFMLSEKERADTTTEFPDPVLQLQRQVEKEANQALQLYRSTVKNPVTKKFGDQNAQLPPEKLDELNADFLARREVAEEKQDNLSEEAMRRKEDLLSRYRGQAESHNEDPVARLLGRQNEQFKRELDEYEHLYERTHQGQHAPQADIDQLTSAHKAAVDKQVEDVRDREEKAPEREIARINQRSEAEQTRRRLQFQQRLAVLDNGGREDASTILSGLQTSKNIAQQLFQDQQQETRENRALTAEQKKVEFAREEAELRRQMGDSEIRAAERYLELKQQSLDHEKGEAGQLFESIKKGDPSSFFKGQFGQVGKNLFENATAPILQQVAGAVNKVVPNSGIFKDVFRGTMFDDPLHATQDNTHALKELTGALRGEAAGGGEGATTGGSSDSGDEENPGAETPEKQSAGHLHSIAGFFKRILVGPGGHIGTQHREPMDEKLPDDRDAIDALMYPGAAPGGLDLEKLLHRGGTGILHVGGPMSDHHSAALKKHPLEDVLMHKHDQAASGHAQTHADLQKIDSDILRLIQIEEQCCASKGSQQGGGSNQIGAIAGGIGGALGNIGGSGGNIGQGIGLPIGNTPWQIPGLGSIGTAVQSVISGGGGVLDTMLPPAIPWQIPGIGPISASGSGGGIGGLLGGTFSKGSGGGGLFGGGGILGGGSGGGLFGGILGGGGQGGGMFGALGEGGIGGAGDIGQGLGIPIGQTPWQIPNIGSGGGLMSGLGGIGGVAGGVMGAFQAFQGFKSGNTGKGVGGIMETAAMFDPEPISKAVLMIGGMIAGMVGGDPRKQREDQIQHEINFDRKYIAPAQRDYYFSMEGGASSLGIGGVFRQGGPTVSQAITVNAMDPISFRDFLKRNTNIFADQMAHTITNSGNQTLNQTMSKAVSGTPR